MRANKRQSPREAKPWENKLTGTWTVCPGSDTCETGGLRTGKGSPKLRVANQPTSGDPHSGFWPASADYQERSGGVASSRREDPKYRSGEKTRRRCAMAPRHGGRLDSRASGEGRGRRPLEPLSLGERA